MNGKICAWSVLNINKCFLVDESSFLIYKPDHHALLLLLFQEERIRGAARISVLTYSILVDFWFISLSKCFLFKNLNLIKHL